MFKFVFPPQMLTIKKVSGNGCVLIKAVENEQTFRNFKKETPTNCNEKHMSQKLSMHNT